MEADSFIPALNDEQRCAAYCTDNAVVAAGAGSGKTMVLASRFTWLVTEKKYQIKEILTLTYTKKAAAQMYRRIHFLLKEIAENGTGEKKELASGALEAFTQAHIQTLDSYCAAIVRQAANRYGLRPDFAIDEERCRQLALDEALSFLIAHRLHPAIKLLYPHKGPVLVANNIFASALFELTHIDSPPNPEKDFNAQCTIICSEWEKQSAVISNKLHELEEAYSGNVQYHPDLAPLLSGFTLGRIVIPCVKELRGFFNELVAFTHQSVIEWTESHPLQKTIINLLEFISSLTALNLKKGTQNNNPVKDILKELRVLFGEFSSLGVYCIQAGLIYSVMMLISDLQRSYLNKKRSEGILTFSDLSRLARAILLEQHDIRQSEKEYFKAIMIDEFQDNNELQKDILFMIAEKENVLNNSVTPAEDLCPGKLFFVGDEKQSIYRFRGADVSVFRKLKNELRSNDLSLKINYRSAPLLIGAFNSIFGGSRFDPEGNSPLAEKPAVFAPEHDECQDISTLPPYEASFSPLMAHKTTSEGKLTLCVLDKNNSEDSPDAETALLSPEENEARFVAEQINSLLHEKDSSGKLKYQPRDIAILFRSRTHQHLFEKHLMLLNIPYTSDDLNGFFYGGPVNDLMSVLRLAAYPMDRAAYAQMLRSPFVGISMPALAICIDAFNPAGGTKANEPFDDNPLSLLSEPDRAKYSQGQQIYQRIVEKTSVENICSLLSELWYGMGYRYETEWNPKTKAFKELYDYLFHLAAKADRENLTLAAFTDYIYRLAKSGEGLRDFQIPLERPSAVLLSTIHKSKGLEFPVVFLCCCDKKGMNDSSDDIYETEESGLTLNPPLPPALEGKKNITRNYFWEHSLASLKGKRTAELRRLLYVGMTRAEKELYLSGCLGISKELGLDATAAEDGDFSRQLKQFIDAKVKSAKGKTGIKGDTILEGVTFFGLSLPAFGANIPDTESNNASFLTVKKIPLYSEQYLLQAEQSGSRFPNDQKGLDAFLEKAQSYYADREIIETPVIPKTRFAPTSLPLPAISDHEFTASSDYSGENSADVFEKVDKLLLRYKKQNGEDSEQFDSGSFGTIAHICVEDLLSGREAAIPPKFARFLSPADSDAFLAAGKELALRFIRSPLGNKAKSAGTRNSEFPFRTLIHNSDGKEFFINGAIDLIFEDEEAFYVVDFKTDKEELPALHIAQMACYYRAASDLFASSPQKAQAVKECRIWLYYLRFGSAVEVTDLAREYNLETQTSCL